jgi:hypothetical protein
MTKQKTRPIHYVSGLMRLELRGFAVLCALLLGLTLADIIRYNAPPSIIIGSLAAGVGLGYVFSHTHRFHWDKDRGEVVARLDLYGLVLLALYFSLELNRTALTSLFVHGNEVATAAYAVLAGVMAGRGIGMSRRIVRILRRKKLLRTD